MRVRIARRMEFLTFTVYYLLKNLQEMNNRYKNPEYKDIIQNLKEELKLMKKDLNETDEEYPSIRNIIEEHYYD